MRKAFLVFFIILGALLHAQDVSYGSFIDKQIELTLQLGQDDIDDAKIDDIIDKKETLYEQKLEEILANKEKYLRLSNGFAAKIYRLNKKIAINKRRGNDYAVIRDEVLIKSYRILHSQNEMIKKILQALDFTTFDEFSTHINKVFVENQEEINRINDKDYKAYLQLDPSSKVIKEMQRRIREYYAIIEINVDVLKYIIESERKMYRLNRYYKYGLIKPALYINHTALSKFLEPILSRFNLSTVKVFLIMFIIFFVFILRKLFFKVFLVIFENLKFKSHLSKKILKGIRRPFDILMIIIGINIIFYVYNDFSRVPFFSALFDMVYVVAVMWSLYKGLNIIAAAKINALVQKPTSVKNELVNISIKIVNFTLLLITVLVILHLAGVNLTAILSGLGIGGFAIALAAKDSLANFFGTLSILMSDAFSQGDWIVIDDVEGVVVEIGLRVTTIRTFDNALISIPNSKLANEAIKNWNRRKVGRRIKFSVSLRYDSAPQMLQQTIEDIKEFLKTHPKLAKEDSSKQFVTRYESSKLVSRNDALGIKNMQLVSIDQLANSSINILVYCFSITTDWVEWAKVRDEVIFGIMTIVEKNGLEFAFPSLSLYPEEEVKVTVDTAATTTMPATTRQS